MLATLLLALAAQQVLPPGGMLQRRDWLLRLEAFAAAHLADAWLRLMVFLALLVIAGAWLLQELRDWMFSLPAFLVATVMLLWSFGDEDYHTAVEQAATRGEGDGAPAGIWVPPDDAAGPAGNGASSSDAGPVGSGPQGSGDERVALVYGGYGRWFAPLFFFALAGPLAAAAYRVVAVLARARRGDEYLRVLAWLDWAPARLLALTFALTGDFTAVVQRLRDGGLLSARPAPRLLDGAAGAALGPAGARDVARLLYRSAGLWLVLLVIAIAY